MWANSALVVNVRPADCAHLVAQHGVLAGVAFQVGGQCVHVCVCMYVCACMLLCS